MGKKSRPVATHPKTIDMIMEALRDSNVNPRKGTSVLSVKKWISANYPDAKLGVYRIGEWWGCSRYGQEI